MWIYICTNVTLIILGIEIGLLASGLELGDKLPGFPYVINLLSSFIATTALSILTGCGSGYLIYRYQTFRSIKTELIQSLYDVEIFFTIENGIETGQLDPISKKKLFKFYELASFKEELLRAEGFETAASMMIVVNLDAAEYVGYNDYEGIQQWKRNTIKRISGLTFNAGELSGFPKF